MKAGFRRQALFSTAVFASILFLVNSVYAQGKQEDAGGRVGTGGETEPAGIILYRAVFQPQNTVSKLDQLDAGTLTDKEGDLIQGLPDDPPKNKFVLPLGAMGYVIPLTEPGADQGKAQLPVRNRMSAAA